MQLRAGYLADYVVVDGALAPRAYVEVDDTGFISRVELALPEDPAPIVHDLGRTILCPGLVNGHSHAFQRAIRGATHRRGKLDPDDFWSWRTAMYETANALTPDRVYEVTRRAYQEMVRAGITCVGEFHYVHHQPDGTPYDDPNELSLQVQRAADDVGIELVLLEVLYQRGGPNVPAAPEQRRFCDRDADAYLQRVDDLRTRGLAVGLAPHSVRAVAMPDLRCLAEYAGRHDLVLHAHVSEQPAENQACQAEHGMTPTAVFRETGCLERARKFCAVHAVHISAADLGALGHQNVCACPSTEADLGDGIVRASELLAAGATLSLGSDSNAVIDLIQEARLLEMHERLRLQRRICLHDSPSHTSLSHRLLEIASAGGASALGQSQLRGRLAPGFRFDAAVVELGHPSLAELLPEHAFDAWILSGSSAPVCATYVGGKRVWSC